MAPIAITTAELLDALASASQGPEHARTMLEIAAETGISPKRVRDALRAYEAQGRLSVHRVSRKAIDGRAATVPAYSILPPQKAGKRRA